MKILGFDYVLSIDNFFYVLKIDSHEFCRVIFSIPKDKTEECLKKIDSKCTVENEDDSFKFSGTLTNMTILNRLDCDQVKIIIKGDTIKYDRNLESRVFQDEGKKFSDILKKTELSEISCSFSSTAKDCDIKNIIVQDRKTDWKFCIKLANSCGLHFFPGSKKWIGAPSSSTSQIKPDDIITMRFNAASDCCSCICRLRQKLDFGLKVSVYGKDLFVDALYYRKFKEEYFFEYHLTAIEAVKNDNLYKESPSYSLYARVTDNDDPDKLGRVQVEFLKPYNDVMQDKAVWIECLSAYPGFVFLPSIDDIVLVKIRGDDAKVFGLKYVEAFDERFKSPDTGYIFVDDKTFFEVDGEKIRFAFGEKINIEINNKDQKILVNTEKTALEISSGTKLKTEELAVEGKNKINLSSSKVDIKGSQGVNIN